MTFADGCIFRPVIERGFIGTDFFLYKSETNILWELGRKGPLSVYKLSKPLEMAEILTSGIDRLTEPKIGDNPNYYRDYVSKVIENLEENGMVRKEQDLKNKRKPIMVEPTIEGLVLYLRESKDRERFDKAMDNYSKYLPFSENWKSLIKKLGMGVVYSALEQAVKKCENLRKGFFRIRNLSLEFQGFVERMFILVELSKVLKDKNEKTARILQTEEYSILRNSYIAYLAVYDLLNLERNSKNSEELIPELDSEKELAFFEKREVGSGSLFRGERLREFFPKYASLEFFLTGMFVENLLWHKIGIKATNSRNDFDVKF